MITNVNPETNIRYGVIALDSLDGDLAQELMFGMNAIDLTFEDIQGEAYSEAEAQASDEGVEESELDEWVDSRAAEIMEDVQIDEPHIRGGYEGVHYEILWLGGAAILFVTEGPVGYCGSLCSPCVPNTGDLDSGFELEDEDADRDEDEFQFKCYVVPKWWLEENS